MPLRTDATPGSTLTATGAVIAGFIILLATGPFLRNHPAMVDLTPYAAQGRPGGGQTSENVPIIGMGNTVLTSYAETGEITEDAITTAVVALSASRYGGMRSVTDRMRSVDPTTVTGIGMLLQDAGNRVQLTLTKLVAALASGFSNVSGSSGTAWSYDTFEAAKEALRARGVVGPYLAVLSPQSWSAVLVDLSTRPGVKLYTPATNEAQVLRGPGFQGSLDGIDIFTTDQAPTSGSDHIGGIFGAQSVAFMEAYIAPPTAGDPLVYTGRILIEQQRSPAAASQQVFVHYYPAVCELVDTRGQKMIGTV